jgi:hypothetical protein
VLGYYWLTQHLKNKLLITFLKKGNFEGKKKKNKTEKVYLNSFLAAKPPKSPPLLPQGGDV